MRLTQNFACNASFSTLVYDKCNSKQQEQLNTKQQKTTLQLGTVTIQQKHTRKMRLCLLIHSQSWMYLMISSCWGVTSSSCLWKAFLFAAVLWKTGLGTLNKNHHKLNFNTSLSSFSLTLRKSLPHRFLRTCSWSEDFVSYLWTKNKRTLKKISEECRGGV